MEWNGGHGKQHPESHSTLSDLHKISEALNPDVEPGVAPVCFVHFPPCWRAEALHAIITGTKQYGTDHVYGNMNPQPNVFDCWTGTSVNCSDTSRQTECLRRPDSYCEIQDKRSGNNGSTVDSA